MSTKTTLRSARVAALLFASLAGAARALPPEGAPVILEAAVHFQSPGGEDVLLEEGNYYVAPTQEPVLVVRREFAEQGSKLRALVGRHGEKLTEPWAESIPSGKDEHHLVLLLPDGRSIDAVGTYSGVRTRDAAPLDASRVRAFRQAEAQWPPPGITTRAALQPREAPEPATEADEAWHEGLYRDQVILKFKEGAAVRAPDVVTRSGERPSLGVEEELMGRMDRRERMQRLALTEEQVKADLARANQILGTASVASWRPLIDRPDRFLEAERFTAEQRSESEHADLGNLFTIKLAEGADGQAIVHQLNALASVELAYLAPIPVDADVPPPTPDWKGNQGYLKPASAGGIDAEYAWTKPGGRGDGVWVIDVEQGWLLSHEDLPLWLSSLYDRDGKFDGDGMHGVAVLGEIVAANDGHGVTGIAHNGRFNVAPVNRKRSFAFWDWTTYNVAEAIDAAASKLRKGDVILIEQHSQGPMSGAGSCPTACGNCPQWGYIAREYWIADFIAIRSAVARGIHVVEAAGNGGMDLDASRYDRRFDRKRRDSGAIVVGASGGDLRPTCWSNFGSRVDVHGWGANVMTLGYGDMKPPGAPAGDKNQWYTATFSGTSSASPIVTGAVMVIVSIQKAAGQKLLTPWEMRRLLVSTGTAQLPYTPPSGMPAQTRSIGPLPDLKAAVDKTLPPPPPPGTGGSGGGAGSGGGSGTGGAGSGSGTGGAGSGTGSGSDTH